MIAVSQLKIVMRTYRPTPNVNFMQLSVLGRLEIKTGQIDKRIATHKALLWDGTYLYATLEFCTRLFKILFSF